MFDRSIENVDVETNIFSIQLKLPLVKSVWVCVRPQYGYSHLAYNNNHSRCLYQNRSNEPCTTVCMTGYIVAYVCCDTCQVVGMLIHKTKMLMYIGAAVQKKAITTFQEKNWEKNHDHFCKEHRCANIKLIIV